MANFCDCNHSKFKSWYAFYKNETIVIRAMSSEEAKMAAAVKLGVAKTHQRHIKIQRVEYYGTNTDSKCDLKV